MLPKLILFLATVLLGFTPIAEAASTDERITRFDSHIVVNNNASIDITENITVYANQWAIKHGIVRELPTRYTDTYGIQHHTSYRINAITVNGVRANYATQSDNDVLSLYIGDKDTELSPGLYTYTLQYHVDNAVNFLSDGDELYWNITGNHWRFRIEQASATITLPEEAKILNYSGYTGAQGERGKQFSVSQSAANQISFVTTTALSPDEGLTLAVAWPKGIVIPPTALEQLKALLQPTTSELIALGLALLTFLYLFRAWQQHGKDPKAGTIIPLFEPPANFSPGAIRYISRMGCDNKNLTTTLVSLATQGYLWIQNTDDVITLKSKNKNTDTLSPDEKSVADSLFVSGDSLELEKSNAAIITKTTSNLQKSLQKTFGNRYFVTNYNYFFKGVLLTVVAALVLIFGSANPSQSLFAIGWLGGWSIGCVFLFNNAWGALSLAFSSIAHFFNAIKASLLLIVFLVGEIIGIVMFTDTISIVTMATLILMVILNVVFFILLKAPTPEGRQLMDHIAGFRLFLSTTERYRLNQLNPPKKTPELFEKYLSYAIALDVENEWGEQFNDVLKTAGTESEPYHPIWYSGPGFKTTSFATLPALLSNSLNSALSSASIASSSSASGGGGSSGGGGGGGGGGGW